MDPMAKLALGDIAIGVMELLDEHGLTEKGWRFEWDRAVRRAGCCNQSTKLITLSKPIFSHTPDLDWRQVALHEIAHALAGPGAGHGRYWQRIARDIGAVPRRCHTLPTPPGNVVGYCNCGATHTRVRMPRAHYLCRTCRVRIVWRTNG